MRIAAGVDVGSTQTKAVVLEENGGVQILGRMIVDTGANVQRAAERAFDSCCEAAGVRPSDVGFVVGTGYGRYKIAFGNAQMTESLATPRAPAFSAPARARSSTWADRIPKLSALAPTAKCSTSS